MSWDEDASYSVGRDAARRRAWRNWLLVIGVVVAIFGAVLRFAIKSDAKRGRADSRAADIELREWRAQQAIRDQRDRASSGFMVGTRVRLSRSTGLLDPGQSGQEHPMLDFGPGQTGAVVRSGAGSLTVRWDAQRWCDYQAPSCDAPTALDAFETGVHPDVLEPIR